jgi:hypothetical protein
MPEFDNILGFHLPEVHHGLFMERGCDFCAVAQKSPFLFPPCSVPILLHYVGRVFVSIEGWCLDRRTNCNICAVVLH